MDDLNSKLQKYKTNACEAITFKLIKTVDDIGKTAGFKPDMAHQIFGESETIFGYTDLKVDILCHASTLKTFINVQYSSKISEKTAKGIEPHNIIETLGEAYKFDLCPTEKDFIKVVSEEDNFTPFGQVRNTYRLPNCPEGNDFVIYYIEPDMEHFKDFVELHKRIQPFLLFYVDGSSFISTDDNQWCYYVIYERTKSDDKVTYAFIGYMTIFKFYAYPENLRPRVSQVVILPPFQGSGHGTQLMLTFYSDFVPVAKVLDIAVEDPSEEFQRLRDFLDCKRCIELPGCLQLVKNSLFAVTNQNGDTVNGEILEAPKHNGDSTNGEVSDASKLNGDSSASEMLVSSKLKGDLSTFKKGKGAKTKSHADIFRLDVQSKLKLNRRQSKRVYEILLLFLLPRNNNVSTTKYRDALIGRAANIYKRVHPVGLGKAGNASGSSTSQFDQASDEEFLTEIAQSVDEVMESYTYIVDKLDKAIKLGKVKPVYAA